MATNLQVDDKLIVKAVDLGGHKSKKAAVTQALVEYINHLQQSRILHEPEEFQPVREPGKN